MNERDFIYQALEDGGSATAQLIPVLNNPGFRMECIPPLVGALSLESFRYSRGASPQSSIVELERVIQHTASDLRRCAVFAEDRIARLSDPCVSAENSHCCEISERLFRSAFVDEGSAEMIAAIKRSISAIPSIVVGIREVDPVNLRGVMADWPEELIAQCFLIGVTAFDGEGFVVAIEDR